MKKILLVDDNELNITLLLHALGENYDISVALSAQEAFESIEHELPDLILLDIVMDEMCGIEMCKVLKDDIKTSNIPVIFVTAVHEVRERVALEAGADGFIQKPFESALLRSKIRKLI